MRKRAFTMAEVMIAGSMTAMLLGVLMAMYGNVAKRAQYATAKTQAMAQAEDLLNEIEKYAKCATDISVSSNACGQCLMIVLPATMSDPDSDGVPDDFTIRGTTNDGKEKFGRGKRVTYYRSNSTYAYTGPIASSRPWVCRAWRTDNGTPQPGDYETQFNRKYARNESKWNLVTGLTYTLDSVNKVLNVRVQVLSDEGDTPRTLTMERTILYPGGMF